MGNNPPPCIPALILKNWQHRPQLPNSYKNRITQQYAHRHTVVIQSEQQIESLKLRMKEHGEMIVKVLYYHHYYDNIYHVYTDEMLPVEPLKMRELEAKHEKRKVIGGFQQLARQYGFMRVCEQMVGADSAHRLKIWINVNPIACQPWNPSASEKQMLNDLLPILDRLIVSSHSFRTRQYSTFQQVLTELSHIPPKQSMHRSTRNEPMYKKQSHNTNMTNVNININIDLEKKKTHTAKLQKIFNPVLCETSRHETENDVEDMPHSSSPLKRPSTQFKQNHTFQGYSHTPTSRGFSPQRKYPKIYQNYGKMGNSYRNHHSQHWKKNKTTQQSPINRAKIQRKNVRHFMNLFIEKEEQSYRLQMSNHGKPKTTHFKNQDNRPYTNVTKKNIPDFLLNKNTEAQQRAKTQMPLNHYPTTQRSQNPKGKDTNGSHNIFDFYVQKFDSVMKQKNKEQKKITLEKKEGSYSILKNQLNDLLEDDEPASPEFERFIQNHAIFVEDSQRKDAVDENEIIKEKVEKKKATFANLKMEALKILGDDF